MRKTRINPRQLVDRLERKYQKKTRFQKYRAFTQHFRQTVFRESTMAEHDIENDTSSLFDYEYTGH